MGNTEDEGPRLVAEFAASLAAQAVHGRYPAATESSTTEQGGQVIATSDLSTVGGYVALVGDIVRYADGSETRIVTGAGAASVYLGRSMALVGSALANGDRINGPVHDGLTIAHYTDKDIPGLFSPGYIVSAPSVP